MATRSQAVRQYEARDVSEWQLRNGAISLSIEAVRELWKCATDLLAMPADIYEGCPELWKQHCL
ncbi:hypothetical protein [Kamptonema sp. UHCC 0994]|uniref:hypothetical protein n=1 Tax=Kamptonema sp. UHCC 0994 TaxID=3031329 RepID=UPI0023BA21B9|nr:hypothetical protein [Kamptonema sp. UHCC 0994]MDF0553631.1 hypothetical protein [Kamptonema sp. UHCC 0994]